MCVTFLGYKLGDHYALENLDDLLFGYMAVQVVALTQEFRSGDDEFHMKGILRVEGYHVREPLRAGPKLGTRRGDVFFREVVDKLCYGLVEELLEGEPCPHDTVGHCDVASLREGLQQTLNCLFEQARTSALLEFLMMGRVKSATL